jgi:hypothetical protein
VAGRRRRKNSDATRREGERRRAQFQHDVVTKARVLADRLRWGQVTPEEVLLYARLGDVAARAVMPWVPPGPFHGWRVAARRCFFCGVNPWHRYDTFEALVDLGSGMYRRTFAVCSSPCEPQVQARGMYCASGEHEGPHRYGADNDGICEWRAPSDTDPIWTCSCYATMSSNVGRFCGFCGAARERAFFRHGCCGNDNYPRRGTGRSRDYLSNCRCGCHDRPELDPRERYGQDPNQYADGDHPGMDRNVTHLVRDYTPGGAPDSLWCDASLTEPPVVYASAPEAANCHDCLQAWNFEYLRENLAEEGRTHCPNCGGPAEGYGPSGHAVGCPLAPREG